MKLNRKFMARLYDFMKKHDALSYDDESSDVRISPRRWEQIAVYVSNSLPVKSQEDGDKLMKNIEIGLKHYQTGESAAIAKGILEIVRQTIEEESGEMKIKADADRIDDSDWRETLKHQVEMKMKIGEERKYIPVVAGLPGAGKTKNIYQLALETNLIPVFVDVHTLSAEDVIGTPLSKSTKDDSIEVTFSRPALYQQIVDQMESGEAKFKRALEQAFGAEEAKKRFTAWKSQKAQYLIFFDELNRTDTKVFNAIRKVLLEKEFNDEYKLPPHAVIVAAINPTGKGTKELTKHVRDVFDVIPVGISWQKFSKHLAGLKLGLDEDQDRIVRDAFNAFVEHFRLKGSGRIDGADPHFYLDFGGSPSYISGREYTSALVHAAYAFRRAYNKEIHLLADPDHDVASSEFKIRQALGRGLMHGIHHAIKHKHGMDIPDFDNQVEDWFTSTDKFSLGAIFKRKVASVKSLSELLNKSFEKMDDDLFNDLEFVNYITSVDPIEFERELHDFLTTQVFKTPDEAFTTDRKQKTMDKKGQTKLLAVESTRLDFILREILHAMKKHDVSNRMVDMVKSAIRKTLSALATADNNKHIKKVLDFNRTSNAYVKSLFAEEK